MASMGAAGAPGPAGAGPASDAPEARAEGGAKSGRAEESDATLRAPPHFGKVESGRNGVRVRGPRTVSFPWTVFRFLSG